MIWGSEDIELRREGDKVEMLLPCKESSVNWERWEREKSGWKEREGQRNSKTCKTLF